MEKNLVLNPCEIANGEMSRKDIKTSINDSAKANSLLAMEQIRFYRELSKAATEAEKTKDEDGKTVTERAVEQALTLPELHKALEEEKKEFNWNGCRYQFREEESVDLSTRSGEEADTWRENKKKAEDIESRMADLRMKLANAKDAMAGAEKRYIAKHPSCKKTVKRTLVVL